MCIYFISEIRKNILFDLREFLLNFIYIEKEKVILVEREVLGNFFELLFLDVKEFFFYFVMFIRKWIGEVCSILLSLVVS